MSERGIEIAALQRSCAPVEFDGDFKMAFINVQGSTAAPQHRSTAARIVIQRGVHIPCSGIS